MITAVKSPLLYIDRKIDQLGMYRVVSLALSFLVAVALIASIVGEIPYTVTELLASLLAVMAAGFGSNWLLAKLSKVHTNHESALITSLIIFFLVVPAPVTSLEQSFIIALAAVAAMFSKYALVWRKQHVLNPVAAGAVTVAVLYACFPLPPGYFETGWWIGQPIFFIPLVIAGVVIVQKVRKWPLVLSFLGVAFLVFLYEEWQFTGELFLNWERFWLSGPSVFLATFMLTEPFTMPPTTPQQRWYGAVVGALSQTTLLAPVIKMTPELALVFGNIATYPLRLRQKLFLKLKARREIAVSTYEFIFTKPVGFSFIAGQYLEWMLPHESSDGRGIRRYFTIASSPTESDVRLAFKTVESGSTYKQSLLQLDEGEELIASQLAGDFLLPEEVGTKLGFIAGGIGITPFRSHVQYMIDSDRKHDTKLLYCCNTVGELAYRDFFVDAATKMDFEFVPVIAKEAVDAPLEHGFVTREMLERRIPDYRERTWYISGPPPMVNAYKKLLSEAGVPRKQIKTDFFPGLA